MYGASGKTFSGKRVANESENGTRAYADNNEVAHKMLEFTTRGFGSVRPVNGHI